MGAHTKNTAVGLIGLALSIVVATARVEAQATTRVSVATDGSQASVAGYSRAAVSADGRFIAFPSFAANLVPDDTNSSEDVFLHDRQTGMTSRVAEGTGSGQASLSASGWYIAFASGASGLVPDDTNEHTDIFVRDLETWTTVRASVTSDGTQATRRSRLLARRMCRP